MRGSILSFVFLLATHLSLSNADHVLELTDNDFKNKLAALDNALVMFYAPCKL